MLDGSHVTVDPDLFASAAYRRRLGPSVPGLALAWAGLCLAYATDWPTSFWITTLGAVIYVATTALPTPVAKRARWKRPAAAT